MLFVLPTTVWEQKNEKNGGIGQLQLNLVHLQSSCRLCKPVQPVSAYIDTLLYAFDYVMKSNVHMGPANDASFHQHTSDQKHDQLYSYSDGHSSMCKAGGTSACVCEWHDQPWGTAHTGVANDVIFTSTPVIKHDQLYSYSDGHNSVCASKQQLCSRLLSPPSPYT